MALFGKGKQESPDQIIDRYLKEFHKIKRWNPDFVETDTGEKISQYSPEDTYPIVMAMLSRIQEAEKKFVQQNDPDDPAQYPNNDKDRYGLLIAVCELMKHNMPFRESDLIAFADWFLGVRSIDEYHCPIDGIVKAFKYYGNKNGLTPELRDKAAQLAQKLYPKSEIYKERRSYIRRLNALPGMECGFIIKPGEAWSDKALEDLGKLKGDRRNAWVTFLSLCETATTAKPSKKWQNAFSGIFPKIGMDQFKEFMLRWLPLVDKPRTREIAYWSEGSPNPNLMIIDLHADILRVFAWCCATVEDSDIARVLTGLAISSFRKVPGIGPRAVRVGNACIYALGEMPGMEAVGQLALLKVKIKYNPARKGIEKALNRSAERLGFPKEDVEEMAVPTYGLEDIGIRREQLGLFTAELVITGTTSTELRWVKPDGRIQKSVPASVKDDYAEELRELKAAAKDIQKMLPAQRERIDNLYLQQKTWPVATWKELYLDHPLVGYLTRQLIWVFINGDNRQSCAFLHGRPVNTDDSPMIQVDDDTLVQLWHPINEDIEEILSWRRWLERHSIRQPFKQAYREVYILTDAERQTGTYSNRFAAHVLKQHQFNALCGIRGWKNALRLMVDADFPPASINLPKWNLRAEFWVESAGDEYGIDTNETGTFLYIVTDQVRFYPMDAQENTSYTGSGYHGNDLHQPVPLDLIHPIVFSEIMRDVDMFVGVASVGNDPTWSDGGPQGRYADYWNSYSFGDLSNTAKTRKDVLERLIPRLKIADKCIFSNKFLVVKGDIRTYKIHLGSGNILMEPNDQYLCIVPKQSAGKSATNRVYLPFEGDNMMVVILSKAFLLADDTKITDPTILSQIKGK